MRQRQSTPDNISETPVSTTQLNSLHPRSTRASWWSPPVLQGGSCYEIKIFLASVSSGIHTMWMNRERRCAWTIAERCGISRTVNGVKILYRKKMEITL